jgi:hypothetical protein
MITLDVPRIFNCSNMTSPGDYWIVIKISMHQDTGTLRKHSTSRKNLSTCHHNPVGYNDEPQSPNHLISVILHHRRGHFIVPMKTH